MKERSTVAVRLFHAPAPFRQWSEGLFLLGPPRQVTWLPLPPLRPGHLQALQRPGLIIWFLLHPAQHGAAP